ncbi:MAG: AsmA family protein [Alistipes sp.]|nr:AsmA family protein [Alistipes sp.]
MKTLAKILGGILVVLLAVLIIVPIVMKPKIVEIVKVEANKMLNARLDFGDLDLSLLRHFPHASVELTDLSLIGVERFEGDTLVAADRISVVVNLMSLFGDEGYEVTKILLKKPQIHAQVLSDGSVNWDVVKSSNDQEEPEIKESEDPSSFKLQVRDFRITDAALSYVDKQTDMSFATSPLNLRLRGDMSATHTDLDLTLSLGSMNFTTGGVKMLNGAELGLNAVVAADLENMRFTLTNTALNLNAITLRADGWIELGDTMAMDIRLDSSKVQFKDILSMIPAFYTKDFEDLTAGGTLSLGAWAKGELKDDKLPAFELSLNVADGRFKYAALPEAVEQINITAKVINGGGTLDATTVSVPNLSLAFAGNSLAVSLSAKTPMSDLQFKAAAKGKVDLGAVKRVYPLDESINLGGIVTLDMAAEGRMSDIEKERYESIKASGTIAVEDMVARLEGLPDINLNRMSATITPSALKLAECGVTIGKSDLSATGSLTNYIGYFLSDATLKGSLALKSKLLDVNELMAMMPDEEQGEAPAVEVSENDAESMQIIEVPKNLNLALAVDMDKILFQKMTFEQFVGRVAMSNGTLAIDKLSLDAFGGKVAATGSYSTAESATSPKLKLSLDFANAKYAETFRQLDFVKQIVPIFEKMGGDYSMKMSLSTTLTETMGVNFDTLNASGEIRSEHIEVQNIKAFEVLATTLKDDRLRNIEARDVKIAFAIRDGRVYTSPFDIKMGGVVMNLSGSTGLDATIDYTADIKLPATATGGVLSNVKANIGGTFTSPKVSVDVKEAAKEAVTNVINQQLQKHTGSANMNEEFEKQAAKIRKEAASAGERLVEEAKKQRTALIGKASGALGKLAAEKSGDALVKAAEKQAANLQAEAEKQIEKLRVKLQVQ